VATAWLLPLLVLPGMLTDATELPKLLALALSTAILAGIALSRLLVARERAFPRSPLTIPVFSLLLISAISLVGTRAPGSGLYAFLYMASLVAAFAMSSSLPSRHRLVQAMLAASGIVSLYAIGQFIGFDPFSWQSHFKPRVFSTMGNPVFLAGFLAATFPLAFARWLAIESEEEKDLLTLLLAVLGIALFLTWTRGSWFAVSVSTLLQLAVLSSSPGGRATLGRNRTWLVALGVVALVSVIILASPRILGKNPVPVADRLRDALDKKSFSVRFRMGTSEVAWRMAFAHPVTGCGLAAFGTWYPLERLKTRAFKGGWLASQEMFTHNDHLQFLAELGITGLGIWLWLLLCALRWAWHQQRLENPAALDGSAPSPGRSEGFFLGVLGIVVAMAVDATFNFPLHIAPSAWLLFTCLGLMAAEQVPDSRAGSAPGRGQEKASWMIIAACSALVVYQGTRHFLADRAMHEGEWYYIGNNHEMADVYFGQGTLLTPYNRVLNFRRSVTIMRVGAYEWQGESLDTALYHAKRAIELGLEEENAWKQLGDVYGKKSMYDRAISALETAHRINSQREDITNNLAYYMALRGRNFDQALDLARDAVSRAPLDPSYNDTLGYILIKAGRYSEAIPPLRLSLKSLPASNKSQAVQSARAEVLEHLAAAQNRRSL